MADEEEVTVRTARWEDLPGVIWLERTSEGAPHWGEAVYRGILADTLPGVTAGAGSQRRLLVAELGGGLAGFAVAAGSGPGDDLDDLDGLNGLIVELESVLVAEGVRRRGVGRGLCEAAIAWARELGAVALHLEVRAASGAGELYRLLGFVVVGRRPGYYRQPMEDALLMRLTLRGRA